MIDTLLAQATFSASPASSLNPLAVPFVRTSPELTQKKSRGKAKKTQVCTDAREVESEFLKAEISALQAKLQSLQSEIQEYNTHG